MVYNRKNKKNYKCQQQRSERCINCDTHVEASFQDATSWYSVSMSPLSTPDTADVWHQLDISETLLPTSQSRTCKSLWLLISALPYAFLSLEGAGCHVDRLPKHSWEDTHESSTKSSFWHPLPTPSCRNESSWQPTPSHSQAFRQHGLGQGLGCNPARDLSQDNSAKHLVNSWWQKLLIVTSSCQILGYPAQSNR